MKFLGLLFLLQLSLPVMALEQGGSNGGAQGGAFGERDKKIFYPLPKDMIIKAPVEPPNKPKIQVSACECQVLASTIKTATENAIKNNYKDKLKIIEGIVSEASKHDCIKYFERKNEITVIRRLSPESDLKNYELTNMCPDWQSVKTEYDNAFKLAKSLRENKYCNNEQLDCGVDDINVSDNFSKEMKGENWIESIEKTKSKIDDGLIIEEFKKRCDNASAIIADGDMSRAIENAILMNGIYGKELNKEIFISGMALDICNAKHGEPEAETYQPVFAKPGTNVPKEKLRPLTYKDNPARKECLSETRKKIESRFGSLMDQKFNQKHICMDGSSVVLQQSCRSMYCQDLIKNFGFPKLKSSLPTDVYVGKLNKLSPEEIKINEEEQLFAECSTIHQNLTNKFTSHAYMNAFPEDAKLIGEKLKKVENDAAWANFLMPDAIDLALMTYPSLIWFKAIYDKFGKTHLKFDLTPPLDNTGMPREQVVDCLFKIDQAKPGNVADSTMDFFIDQSLNCLNAKNIKELSKTVSNIYDFSKKYDAFAKAVGLVGSVTSFVSMGAGPAGAVVTTAVNSYAFAVNDANYSLKTGVNDLLGELASNKAQVSLNECFGALFGEAKEKTGFTGNEPISNEECKKAREQILKADLYKSKAEGYKEDQSKVRKIYMLYLITEIPHLSHVSHAHHASHGVADNLVHFFKGMDIAEKGLTGVVNQVNFATSIAKMKLYLDYMIPATKNDSDKNKTESKGYAPEVKVLGEEVIKYVANNKEAIDKSSPEKTQESIDKLIEEYLMLKVAEKNKSTKG